MGTTIEAVAFTLLDNGPVFIDRGTELILTDPLFSRPPFGPAIRMKRR